MPAGDSVVRFFFSAPAPLVCQRTTEVDTNARYLRSVPRGSVTHSTASPKWIETRRDGTLTHSLVMLGWWSSHRGVVPPGLQSFRSVQLFLFFFFFLDIHSNHDEERTTKLAHENHPNGGGKYFPISIEPATKTEIPSIRFERFYIANE
jgi:hypothetical protein